MKKATATEPMANSAKEIEWLIVAYDVPNEPSKYRVKMWRDLKSSGGLYPQLSFCLLPYLPDTISKLEKLRTEVQDVGKMLILQANGITKSDSQALIQMINEQTERQYLEILEECQEFQDEIKSNIHKKVFTDEEIQELEESLEGLNRWFEKIVSFDVQKVSKTKPKVRKMLEACKKTLDSYTSLVETKKRKLQNVFASKK
jgi:DNA repair exonuclease SbcCD nuclease subunit